MHIQKTDSKNAHLLKDVHTINWMTRLILFHFNMASPLIKQQMEAFTHDFETTINRLDASLKVSTMTVSVTLNQDMDLDTFKTEFSSEKPQSFIKDVMGSTEAIQIKPRGRKGKTFSNCVICKLPTQETSEKHIRAVKVFCNGGLHITGFKSISDSLYIAEVFATLFEIINGGSGLDDEFTIKEFSIQMINVCYNLPQVSPNQILNLNTLYTKLKSLTTYYVQFNNDHYAGVIVKAPAFSILIFESGSVIFTALTSSSQLANAFNFITDFFTHHGENVISMRPSSSQAPKHKRQKKVKGEFNYGDYLILK
jgi:TATA-box binding protein (TBP) (component of TFIID and TFIIIB)